MSQQLCPLLVLPLHPTDDVRGLGAEYQLHLQLLLLQQTGRRIATQPNGGGLLSAPKVAYYNASGVERRGDAVERLTFCLVRHPYSRLLSYYLDKLQLHKPKASVMPHTFGARQRSLHPGKPLNKSFAEVTGIDHYTFD